MHAVHTKVHMQETRVVIALKTFPTKRRGGVEPSCMLSILRYTCRRQYLYSRSVLKICTQVILISYEKKGWCHALMHTVHSKGLMQEINLVLRLIFQNLMEESYSCLIMHYVSNTPVCNEDRHRRARG